MINMQYQALLTLNALSIFFFRENKMTFHVSFLLGRQFTLNVKHSLKKKSVLFAAVVISTLRINCSKRFYQMNTKTVIS